MWPGAHPPVSLSDPTLIALPLGVLGCVVGTLLSRPAATGDFGQIQIEAELGRSLARADAD